jgi:hypothetical protein
MKRDEALQAMATSLQRSEPVVFFVGLVGYFIDGCPYVGERSAVPGPPSIRRRPRSTRRACLASSRASAAPAVHTSSTTP